MQLSLSQKEFIRIHGERDVRELALRFSGEDMPLLLSQIAGRQVAKVKIPSWYEREEILYPVHLSLEQASSELTARYKASLVAVIMGISSDALTDTSLDASDSATSDTVCDTVCDTACDIAHGRFADLTGGVGVDFSFLASLFGEADYVEQNSELCDIAMHNFGVLQLRHARVHCDNAEHFLERARAYNLIFLDPARRDDTGRKVVRIEDCTPDITLMKKLLQKKAEQVMVKYSPMLDIALAVKTLGNVREVHIVSLENECKELLFLLSKVATEAPRYVAVNLKRSGEMERFAFTMEQEQQTKIAFTNSPGRYLYEPNASILKAGAFKGVAQAFNLTKLHTNSHLYTSNEWVADFPGRSFEVTSFFVPNKQQIKEFTKGTKKANIAVRNFPMTVAEIRRKTGLAEGGDSYLFATTLSDERKVYIVCRKV